MGLGAPGSLDFLPQPEKKGRKPDSCEVDEARRRRVREAAAVLFGSTGHGGFRRWTGSARARCLRCVREVRAGGSAGAASDRDGAARGAGAEMLVGGGDGGGRPAGAVPGLEAVCEGLKETMRSLLSDAWSGLGGGPVGGAAGRGDGA
jgi:hypothetical protein